MKISEQQFDYVYNEYAKELYNIAYGYTLNREDSIDIMQNAYVVLLESNKKFESNEHIKYFLIRVTINESIDLLKSAYKKKVVKDNDILVKFPEIKKEELPYDLSLIVNNLPEKYKTIIVLYYYDDMKIKDISNVLRISESAVKKRLERARNLIKEIIERDYKHD
ncbi:MAG: sigma-70 family RNA polymerase sigma factor [Bacilli bacterium]|nr:sigma-70 family RNA polymerase sigma factor [Bacilli bacterium]